MRDCDTLLKEATDLLRHCAGNETSVDVDLTACARTAVVTLRNPDKRNALTPKMMLDFSEVVQRLEDEARVQVSDDNDHDNDHDHDHDNDPSSLRTVVLRGEGNFFLFGCGSERRERAFGLERSWLSNV